MKVVKPLLTMLLIGAGMLFVMIMCGENTDGSIADNFLVGGFGLLVTASLWSALAKRRLIVTLDDIEDDECW